MFKNSQSIRKELRPMFLGYVITDSILNERINDYDFSALEYCTCSRIAHFLESCN